MWVTQCAFVAVRHTDYNTNSVNSEETDLMEMLLWIQHIISDIKRPGDAGPVLNNLSDPHKHVVPIIYLYYIISYNMIISLTHACGHDSIHSFIQ